MIIKHIEGCTRTLGEAQGYIPLPLRDEMTPEQLPTGETVMIPRMVTAWEPTPEEAARLGAGATLYLSVLGIKHPPVSMFVGEAPAK